MIKYKIIAKCYFLREIKFHIIRYSVADPEGGVEGVRTPLPGLDLKLKMATIE